LKFYALIFFTFLLTGCATYGLQFDESQEDWRAAAPPPENTLQHRTYLIGDAGNAAEGSRPDVLAYLQSELPAAPAASHLVYLGDNIYPGGFPPPGHPERPIAEHRLRVQIDPVKLFPGKTIWIPGNHDWYRFSLDGLREQRKFIRDELGQKDIWLPRINCGGPAVVEVNDDLVYIIVDSQWWLTNWAKHPGVNEGCDASNRTEFLRLFRREFQRHREKHIVVMMHHPMETYGRHGGHFTLKDHLRPVPVVGSVIPFLRGNVGTPQDNLNARFQELRRKLLATAKINGGATFVSGHEHNLQYIEKDRQQYIVSGASSKSGPSGMGEGSRFAYGGHGYSVLDLYENGSLWVSFFAVNEGGKRKELLYRKRVQGPRAADVYEAPDAYPDYPITKDSLNAQLVRDDYNRGQFGRFILGDHYRNAYDESVQIPMLDLSTYKGGLRPVKEGGGNQTISLRLEGKGGRQYTMRSLDKDPTATIGVRLTRSKVIQKLVEDGFTAAHPIGALPVARLAEAAGINHTNPKLVFVPAQPALGKYNPDFSDKVYLIEERPDDDGWMSFENFGRPEEIQSTAKALEELRQHPDHVIDLPAMARARAFDLLIGDWDRHDDQWRWAEEERDGKTYYVPIPRDRDQAFSNYDGVLAGVLRRVVPATRSLNPFEGKPKRVHWSTQTNRFFDATFLAEIDRETWLREARHLRATLTDEVIEAAFRTSWPPEVLQMDGLNIMTVLRVRRDNIVELIEDFYAFRAERIEVVGTEEEDLFDLEVLPGGNVRVTVSARGVTFYERVVMAEETKYLTLFGLEGSDEFRFNGTERAGMLIRLVGGPGTDRVRQADGAEATTSGRVLYYDYTDRTEPSDFGGVAGLRDKRSPQAKYNIYSRLSEDKDFDFFSLMPLLGRNPDNGFLLGGVATLTTYKFKKEPFSTQHVINGRYAFETGGARFAYQGTFTDFYRTNALRIDARAQTSLYGVNFYGFGNDTDNPEDINPEGRNFNRVRQQYIDFSPQLMRRLNPAATWYVGPRYSVIETDRTEGRFLALNSEDQSDEGIFSNYHYLGVQARFEFDNRIPAFLPGRGIAFFVEGRYQTALAGPGKDIPRLRAALTFNQQVDDYGDFIFANRVGYDRVFQDDIAYFQAATLGGSGERPNFRGFRQERFSGQRAFYVNNDVRWRIFSARNSNLPFSFGVLAGVDLGRVWLKGEDSNTWHYSYGGGIFISPLDYATLNASYFVGDGLIGRFSFGTGFFF